MSILNYLKKINPVGSKTGETMLVSAIIVLVAFGSFGLGRLSKAGEVKPSLTVKHMEANVTQGEAKNTVRVKAGTTTLTNPQGDGIPSTEPGGFIVASKTGKKYHFPWCAGAHQIKEENKVWFANAEEARLAGYTPAANCRGLE